MLPAIILAAGQGTRLAPLTDKCPKALLEVGDSTLLDLQLQHLQGCGIDRVFIVTGHQHQQISRHLQDRATCLFNPEYATTNNIVSLWMAQEVALEGFLLLNSDVLFHGAILRDFIRGAPPNAIVLNDSDPLDSEDMKVILRDGFLHRIGKELPLEESHGEYIGMARFDAAGAQKLFSAVHSLLNDNHHNGWYEEGFGAMAEGFRVATFSTAGHPWVEIDDHADLARARQMAASGAFQPL